MASRVSPCFSLAAYAERLLEGRRVVVLGDATSPFATALVERGARLVQVFDADAGRVALATAEPAGHNISSAPLAQAGVVARDGAFDIGFIEDLSQAETPVEWLQHLQRTLSARAVAFIVSPNPDVEKGLLGRIGAGKSALGYYDLYALVAEQFEHVRMLGQAPFVGYAVAEFGPEGDPEIAIDSDFLADGAEQAEFYIAVASREPLELDAFDLVQLPLAEIGWRPGENLADEKYQRALKAEETARARELELAAELATLRRRGARSGEQYEAEIAELKRALGKREAWTAELEARAATADERADQLQSELEQERRRRPVAKPKAEPPMAKPEVRAEELRELATKITNLERDLTRSRELEQKARGEAGAAGEAARTTEAARQAAEESARESAEAAERECTRLERQLAERAEHIRLLERDVRHAERTGEELLRELGEAKLRGTEGGLGGEVATPAAAGKLTDTQVFSRLAELEGDLEAARWTIESLESRLDPEVLGN